MGENTRIAWTDHTFNGWFGCQRVSPGCENCYAESLVTKRMKLKVWGPPKTTDRKRSSKSTWQQPVLWNRKAELEGTRARVFCSSLADVFEDHQMIAPWRRDLFSLIEQTPSLDWQLLTKRPENMLRMLPKSWLDRPLKNVWLGTTAEDQQRAEDRIPHLLATPAVVRFVSCEPLLEPITLQQNWLLGAFDHCPDEVDNDCLGCPGYSLQGGDYCGAVRGPRLSWIIVGGESGPGARVFRAEWARSIVRQCKEAGVPCFVKQMGAAFVDEVNGICGRDVVVPPEASPPRRLADRAGADPAEWPTNLLVREFPHERE